MMKKLNRIREDDIENMKQIPKRAKIVPQLLLTHLQESDKENGIQISAIGKAVGQYLPYRNKKEPFRSIQIPRSSTFNFPIGNIALLEQAFIPKLVVDGKNDSFDSVSSLRNEHFFENDSKRGFYSEETSSSGFSTTNSISSFKVNENDGLVAFSEENSLQSSCNNINQFEEFTQIELMNYYVDHFNCEEDCNHTSDENIITVIFNGNHKSQDIYKRSFLRLLHVITEQRNKTSLLIDETKSDILEIKLELKELGLLTKFLRKVTELNNEDISKRYIGLIRLYGWDSFKEMLLNLIFVEKKKNSLKSVLKTSDESLLKEFIQEEFTESMQRKCIERLERKLKAFGTPYPFAVILNILESSLKLQDDLIKKSFESFKEFEKVSQFKINRDCIFPSYFCLFEKLLFFPECDMRKTLLIKFRNYFLHLNSQKMLEEFLREVLKNFNKYKSVEWLKDLLEKRLDWLEKEVTLDQGEKIDWRMASDVPDLPEQFIKFKRFLESNQESEILKNMFNGIAEARIFAKKYSVHKSFYSCIIEAFGTGKKASILVRKTKDGLNNAKNVQRGYKKELELIRKQAFSF